MKLTKPVLLAVSSGGGHWIQLLRLKPAFANIETVYASVEDRHQDVYPATYQSIPDANRDTKFRLIYLLLKLTIIIFKFRPRVIVSTGAAPGYLAIRLGKLIGAKGLFIDSIANAERLSVSGEMASHHADLMLTQWPELQRPGVRYEGNVITQNFGERK
jgi:UDP-N-acetylglucosamine:LPS N-acetylglucosamine transferase